MRKILLLGILIGFVLKIIDINLPKSVPIPGRYKAAFNIPGYGGAGWNDLGYLAIWILIWFFKGTIGLGGLLGWGSVKILESIVPGGMKFSQSQ